MWVEYEGHTEFNVYQNFYVYNHTKNKTEYVHVHFYEL